MRNSYHQDDYQDYFKNEELNENRYYNDFSGHDNDNNNPDQLDGPDFKKMDKNRKTALIILGVFSVMIVVIWFINFRNSLRHPLTYKGEIPVASQDRTVCVGGNCNNVDLSSGNLDLKLIDTDGDGISDWDELFLYGTSPYLEDTDGDGLTDYEEIFIYKTDPLCPEGQDCAGSLYQGDAQGTDVSNDGLSDLYNLLMGLDETNNQGQPSNNLLTNQITPDYLRSMLLEEGFSQEDLGKINDDELMKIFYENLSNF